MPTKKMKAQADDETAVANTRLWEPETTIVPKVTPDKVAALAWSEDAEPGVSVDLDQDTKRSSDDDTLEDDDLDDGWAEEDERHYSWGTVKIFAGFMIFVVAVAAWTGWYAYTHIRHQWRGDDKYLALLAQQYITVARDNELDAFVAFGHTICTHLEKGDSADQADSWVGNPAWTAYQTALEVSDAVQVYCPSYSQLVLKPSTIFSEAPAPAPAPTQTPMTTDEAFVKKVKEVGIQPASDQSVVAAAHQACEMMNQGRGLDDVYREMDGTDGGITRANAPAFVGVAMATYCPEADAH